MDIYLNTVDMFSELYNIYITIKLDIYFINEKITVNELYDLYYFLVRYLRTTTVLTLGEIVDLYDSLARYLLIYIKSFIYKMSNLYYS